jgi:hypothetical protein
LINGFVFLLALTPVAFADLQRLINALEEKEKEEEDLTKEEL